MRKILVTFVFILALVCVLNSCLFLQDNTSTTEKQTTPEAPSGTLDETPDDTPAKTPSVGLAYKVNEDKETCTITGLGKCTDTDIVIGSYLDGYKVTAIGEIAFSIAGCKNFFTDSVFFFN